MAGMYTDMTPWIDIEKMQGNTVESMPRQTSCAASSWSEGKQLEIMCGVEDNLCVCVRASLWL